MDDPWGSPWVDEIQHTVIATKVNDDTEGSQVRPKTPIKTSTSGLEVKADSPWNDEADGFGDWAAVPADEEVGERGLSFDGVVDAWEPRKTGDNGSMTKSNLDGLAQSWDEHTPGSDDAISKNVLPNSAGTVRLPSPDPWATQSTLNNEEHTDDTPKMGGCKPVVEDGEDIIEGNILGGVSEPLSKGNGETLAELVLPEPAETMPEANTTHDRHMRKSSSEGQEGMQEVAEATGEAITAPDADHQSSRPSSSPSDRSHHDEILLESPRTSLDEEPKRPQVPRQVSLKIQGLVEHFDGLARVGEEVLVHPGRSRSRSETPPLRNEKIGEELEKPVDEEKKEEADEDDDDFGDFEDGQSEDEANIEQEVKRPVTPAPTLIQNQTTTSPASKIASPQESPPRSRHIRKDFGRVEFAADTSALDTFYSKSDGDAYKDDAVEKVFIMDTIPYDSFQSLPERKTWYRISRYGSMRKHNSGDDENYIRVTWSQSQVREQTLKIVARWMEEDRISGRVILGGGSKGSTIFGWNDPNAPAVPLASALAAKHGRKPTPVNLVTGTAPEVEVPREWPKGLVRDRSLTKGHAPSTATRRSSTKMEIVSDSHKASSHKPAANFGWNTIPASKEPGAIPFSEEPRKATPFSESLTLHSQKSSSASLRATASTMLEAAKPIQSERPANMNGLHTISSKPFLAVTPPVLAPISNEDDDWGEMVASPVLSTTPVLPSPQGLRHKKSQSLSGSFSPQHALPIQASTTLPFSTISHKSTRSFDDILVPKSRNVLDSKADAHFPSTIFTPVPASSVSPSGQLPQSPVISATSNHDPWASADFSFFDSPAPAPVAAKVSLPAPVSKQMQKTRSLTKAPSGLSPLRHGKTPLQIEQDELVASIVNSLPDLSYMSRR